MQTTGSCSRIVYALLLLLAALIWGSTFVAQSVGSESVGAFTFVACRSFLAGFALLPLAIFRARAEQKRSVPTQASRRTLWLGGALCGIAFVAASSLQQIGVGMTTVGKAGFITALYIVIVPICGIFVKKRVPWHLWCGVGIAVAGMYFLCITEQLTVERGDLFVFLCAVVFSLHILIIDHFSSKVDGVQMSCIQFFVAGALCLVPMLLLEKPSFAAVSAAAFPILYAGLLSGAVGFTLQIVAQKELQPTVASLIMSLESVFSALSGWLILHEKLSARELLGCGLVFSAVILAQIPAKGKTTKKGKQENIEKLC